MKHKQLFTNYLQLAMIYTQFKPNQIQYSIYYLQKAQSLQQNLNQLSRSNASIYQQLAKLYFNYSNFELALTYYFKSLEIFTTLYSEIYLNVAVCYHYISEIYFKKRNFELSIEYSLKRFDIAKKLGYDHYLISLHYYLIAQIYFQQGKFIQALQNAFKSIQFKFNDIYLSLFYYFISAALGQLNRYDQSLKYIQKAIELDLRQQEQDKLSISLRYYQLSNLYFKTGRYDQSLKYCLATMNLEKKVLRKQSYSKYHFLSRIYLKLKKYELALESCYKSLNNMDPQNQEEKSNHYILIGTLYGYLLKFQKAIKYHLMSQQIFKKLDMVFTINNSAIYHQLALIYGKMKKLKAAIEFEIKCVNIVCRFSQIDKIQCAQPLQTIGLFYYDMNKFIISNYYINESQRIYFKHSPQTYKKIDTLDLIAERTDLAWNFKSFNHFCVSIQKKIAKLKLLQLHKMLHDHKIILKFVNTFKSGSKSHLECLVKISLCYKYLNIRRYYLKYVDIIKRINFQLSNQDQIDFKNLCQSTFI